MKMEQIKSDKLEESKSIKHTEDKKLKHTPETDLSTQLIGEHNISIRKGWDEIFHVQCQIHCLYCEVSVKIKMKYFIPLVQTK